MPRNTKTFNMPAMRLEECGERRRARGNKMRFRYAEGQQNRRKGASPVKPVTDAAELCRAITDVHGSDTTVFHPVTSFIDRLITNPRMSWMNESPRNISPSQGLEGLRVHGTHQRPAPAGINNLTPVKCGDFPPSLRSA
jgi:hypothetical protein